VASAQTGSAPAYVAAAETVAPAHTMAPAAPAEAVAPEARAVTVPPVRPARIDRN
jgi:hypothetical protein